MIPLKVEQHTVSHMKALIGGELEYRGLMRDSLFTLRHPLCKIALLVHRMGLVRFVSLSTVVRQISRGGKSSAEWIMFYVKSIKIFSSLN